MRQVSKAVAGILVLWAGAWGQDSDGKLAKRIEKLDEKFVAALGDLAKTFDQEKNPEAAHFFASCGVGFGSKDSAVAVIKTAWEIDLFLGKVRGGEQTKEPGRIDGALRGHAQEYRRVMDLVLEGAKDGPFGSAAKQALYGCGIKYEVAKSAHEYVGATQRFNALRRAMGLRAILWDFEVSHKLILAAWYMAETGDASSESKSDTASIFYDPIVERAKAELAKSPFHTLKEHPEFLRSYALSRQDILNPNSRRLWLAQWQGGKKLSSISLYAIPLLPFREDIPTPSQRYRGETVAKGWIDTEETVEVSGKKTPYVKYPYDGEPDTPWCFSNGRGAQEAYWEDTEYRFLERAGVPVMFRFFSEGDITNLSGELRDSSGKSITCRVYGPSDKRVALPKHLPTILIVPEKHLERGATYSVWVKCTFQGVQVEKTWRFTTRSR